MLNGFILKISSLLFTELVQLIVSRSDSEIEVPRCRMKKNT